MKVKLLNLFLCTALISATALAGCSKSGNSTLVALEPSKIPDTMNQAFGKAAPETQQAMATYLADFQAGNTPAAFSELRKMSHQEDLTLEQHVAVAKAFHTTLNQLQTAAKNGDAAAQAAVHQYLSSR
jgi:hypothetical protein